MAKSFHPECRRNLVFRIFLCFAIHYSHVSLPETCLKVDIPVTLNITMHELGITKDLIESIRREISREKGITHVRKIRVRLGKSAYVSGESLQFWFENLIRGTELDGVSLEFISDDGNKIVVDSIEGE